MKAPNGDSSLLLLTLVTICELKFLSLLKEELDVPPLPVPETEILSAVYDGADIISPNQSVTEETALKLNFKLNTLALTALNQNSKVKFCCPKSMIEWKKKHKMETSQNLSNCKERVDEPKRRR